jgi:hypothetical protein
MVNNWRIITVCLECEIFLSLLSFSPCLSWQTKMLLMIAGSGQPGRLSVVPQ